MLFAIPRVGDYQGGASMLGLGDIVLPGLLLMLSFASRNGDLNDIWDNPRAIRAANALLFVGRIEAEDEDDARASI
eukprot:scaffold585_cov161-Skeletonema_marinoi.AAC.2